MSRRRARMLISQLFIKTSRPRAPGRDTHQRSALAAAEQYQEFLLQDLLNIHIPRHSCRLKVTTVVARFLVLYRCYAIVGVSDQRCPFRDRFSANTGRHGPTIALPIRRRPGYWPLLVDYAKISRLRMPQRSHTSDCAAAQHRKKAFTVTAGGAWRACARLPSRAAGHPGASAADRWRPDCVNDERF